MREGGTHRQELMQIQEGLKAFMRLYPQGVTIVTTRIDGEPHGLTVSSFTSVSLSPPLVMFAIDRSSRSYRAIRAGDWYGIHILSSDQSRLSEIFAGRISVDDKFRGINLDEGPGGVPVIRESPAHLICKRYAVYEAGDHDLILCSVVDVTLRRKDFKPLVYRNRYYTTVLE